MRVSTAFTLLAVMLWSIVPLSAANTPAGLEFLFKGIEPGKKFHVMWPPPTGQTILGIMVQAKKPEDLAALYEPIESLRFRNPDYKNEFATAFIEYASADLNAEKTVEVNVAFSQLDALANAAKSVATGTPPSGANAGGSENGTGIDFSRITKATVKMSGIRVEYYTLGTLMDIKAGAAVNNLASAYLKKENQGWFIHRALRVDGIEYNLTSNKDIEAGFFAQLVKWIPGVRVKYVNNRTVRLSTTSPVYIGYKLWRPDSGFQGAAAEEVDPATVGIGAEEIDAQLK